MKLEELLNEGKNKTVTVPFNGIEGHRSKLAKAGIKVVSTGEGGGGNTEATLEGPEKNIRQYLAKLWNLNTDDEEIDELFEGQLQEEAKASKAKPEDDGEKMYFGIGCWQDPYRRGGDEWFIIGPYETSKEARAGVNRKHENGQPRGIRDWSSGPVKVVDSVAKLKTALTKLKLQIPKAIETGEDIYPGEVALWRPNEL